MRVIAGFARGAPLKAPKGNNTRPTTDRTRESLFAILGDLSGARVVDLFAGSGALGIEALSRGATQAVFVDKDRQAIQVVKDNLAKTKLAERATVLPLDTLRFLAAPGRYLKEDPVREFDLAFVDPPYASGLYGEVFARLAAARVLAASGLLVIEQSFKSAVLAESAGFILQRSERYGDTIVSFYRQANNGGSL